MIRRAGSIPFDPFRVGIILVELVSGWRASRLPPAILFCLFRPIRRALPRAFIPVYLLVLATFSPASAGQGGPVRATTIEGIVVDQTGAAVADAEIAITSSSFNGRAVTDSRGGFRFKSAPQTIVTLSITAKGFARVERKLNPATEDTRQLHIVLAPASISERVTVT